jgi:hypothetical protein
MEKIFHSKALGPHETTRFILSVSFVMDKIA